MTPEQRLIKQLGKQLAKRDAVIADLRKSVAYEQAEVKRLAKLLQSRNGIGDNYLIIPPRPPRK